FEKRDAFFQPHTEIFTYALGGRLIVKALHILFRTFHRRRPRRRKKEHGDKTTNDCAVKGLVLCQVFKHGPDGRTRGRQLDRPLAESFLEFIEIAVVPGSRIADDYDGFGLYSSPRERPEVIIVVQARSVTKRAGVELPQKSRGNDDNSDRDRDAAPRRGRNWPLELQRRPAMNLFFARRAAKEHPRQPKSLFKIGNK